MNYQGKKFLSLPEQVEVNKRNIEQLKRDEYRTFTTLLAIENLSYLELNQLVENSRNVSVGDLIYGSDAYYGQVTRVGGSVVEFTTVGLMPAGPKGDQGIQGPEGPIGPIGPKGDPGDLQVEDLPGANLAMPDLTNATDLGDVWYQLYKDSDRDFRYNVISGNYNLDYIGSSSSITTAIGRTVFKYPIGKNKYTITMEGDYSITILDNNNNVVKGNNDYGITYLDNSNGDIDYLFLYSSITMSHNFKLQLEIGDTATPYTVPGQIPQYANREQQAWITPTLVNGATGTLQYRKNVFGRVEFRGYVNQPSGQIQALNFITLPAGYRPFNSENVLNDTSMILISPDGSSFGRLRIASTGFSHLDNIFAGQNINFNNISYVGV